MRFYRPEVAARSGPDAGLSGRSTSAVPKRHQEPPAIRVDCGGGLLTQAHARRQLGLLQGFLAPRSIAEQTGVAVVTRPSKPTRS